MGVDESALAWHAVRTGEERGGQVDDEVLQRAVWCVVCRLKKLDEVVGMSPTRPHTTSINRHCSEGNQSRGPGAYLAYSDATDTGALNSWWRLCQG